MNEILLKEIDIMVNNRKKDNEKNGRLACLLRRGFETAEPDVPATFMQSVKEPICPIKYLRLQHKHT